MLTKDKKTFIAEISELPETFNPLSAVWDDACDAGFILVSAKTGKEITFTFWKEDKNRDGEVAGYRFKPCLRNNEMHLKDLSVLIIND
jgi:hypothetical protein